MNRCVQQSRADSSLFKMLPNALNDLFKIEWMLSKIENVNITNLLKNLRYDDAYSELLDICNMSRNHGVFKRAGDQLSKEGNLMEALRFYNAEPPCHPEHVHAQRRVFEILGMALGEDIDDEIKREYQRSRIVILHQLGDPDDVDTMNRMFKDYIGRSGFGDIKHDISTVDNINFIINLVDDIQNRL